MTTAAVIGRSARYDVASHLEPTSARVAMNANSRVKDLAWQENDDNTSSAEAITVPTLQLVQHTRMRR